MQILELGEEVTLDAIEVVDRPPVVGQVCTNRIWAVSCFLLEEVDFVETVDE